MGFIDQSQTHMAKIASTSFYTSINKIIEFKEIFFAATSFPINLSSCKTNSITKIDRIEMPIIVDFTASLKAYQNGELDWTVLPNEEIVNYKDNPEVVEMKEARVIYLLLNNKNKLFSNAKVRRAVSMAIDRKALVDKIKNINIYQ